jgi:hypothetical protein
VYRSLVRACKSDLGPEKLDTRRKLCYDPYRRKVGLFTCKHSTALGPGNSNALGPEIRILAALRGEDLRSILFRMHLA